MFTMLNEVRNIESRYSNSVFDMVREAQKLCEKINERVAVEETVLSDMAVSVFTMQSLLNAIAGVATLDNDHANEVAHSFVNQLDGFHHVVEEFVDTKSLSDASIDKMMSIVAASTDIFGVENSAGVALFNAFSSVRYAVKHDIKADGALYAFGVRVLVMQTATCIAAWRYADKNAIPADIREEFSKVSVDTALEILEISRNLLKCGSIAEMDRRGLRAEFARAMRSIDVDA